MSPDEEEDLLRSFLNEVADAEPSLQAFLSRRSKHEGMPGNSGDGSARQQGQPEAARLTAWTAGPLRRKLRELSALHVSDDGPSPGGTGGVSAPFAVATPPGLVYATLDALVRLVSRLLLLVDAASSDATPTLLSAKQDSADAPPLASLVDLTFLCLANLAESPSWRHVFLRVLHEVQLEHQQSRGGAGGGSGGEASTATGTTLQEYLWRRVVVADWTTACGAAVSEARPSPPAPAVDRAAVRLCCSMVRHCPLSFSASSYASLAPYLAEYVLGEGGGDGGGSGGGGSGGSSHTSRGSSSRRNGSKGGGGAQTDLMVVLDLFAACARGSPHFRQYVKGLRRKRELFRRLLGLLGPMCDGRIVVRALCALTRVLAGDPLEGKVFDRGNALETASLVIDNLLDLSGCSERVACVDSLTPKHGGAGAGSRRLGEQRRFADVASDLARSQVFTSVLADTGRLASFLGEAVAVLVRAAADVFGRLSTDIAAAGTTAATVATERRASRRQEETTRPEPLLGALCSFCLEHSPARSTFIQALLDGSSSNSSSKQATAASARTSSTLPADPCAALFVLCLHPHLPSAAAASTLLQCLLVGGGALGAVSGPSTGAAAGVGVIPAGFLLGPTGGGVSWTAAAAAGIGREDPLQAALLERIGAVALGGGRQSKRTPAAGRGGGGGVRRADGSPSSDESDGSDDAGIDDGDGNERSFGCGSGLEHPAGLADAASNFEGPGGGLSLLVLRLRQIGGDLASAQAKQQLGLSSPSLVAARPAWPVSAATGAEALKARAVEMELELTSVLCLLSSLALAVPAAGRALARALPLEAAFAPVLAAPRCVLCGTDPADFPRAPVEIVLVSLTLIAQLGVELSGTGGGSGDAESSGDDITASDAEEEEGYRRRARRRRRRQRQGRQDAARAARLRRFLGEQAAAGEVKLCLGHAACRAESKDLARRAAALISLLQAGGGADALLVADSLYAFAQAAEAREGGLRSRAAAAEAAACRERAAGARRAAALEEAEGLVAQIESRNAEDIRRLSEQESGARRRLEDSHARAARRGEVSLRRAEENVADLERVLSSKEEALGCASREARAKDLEIAALRGDLAGEQRLRAAVTVKLEAASAERDEAS
ncbi:unnamed protein product, partial [Ectocarpus sp. 13 AM-2016]